jgi:hypothetical protein
MASIIIQTMKRRKNLIIIATIIILITAFLLYFTRGKIFDKYDDLLKVNNKSSDTLCFWFAPLSNNKEMFDIMQDKGFTPSWILPKSIESYPAPDWEETIKRVKGGKLYLLDYSTIMLYKNNRIKLDSNVLTNIFRYEFPLQKDKLDSCDWLITYNYK